MDKKIFISMIASFSLLSALEMPPMPPMIPMDKNKTQQQQPKKKETRSTPKSCDMIPPMVIFLPPPMEAEVDKCKNELHKPKKEFVEKQLEKLFKKKVNVKKIEIVEKFNQLYKITYDGGVLLTNKSVDAFIKQ